MYTKMVSSFHCLKMYKHSPICYRSVKHSVVVCVWCRYWHKVHASLLIIIVKEHTGQSGLSTVSGPVQ